MVLLTNSLASKGNTKGVESNARFSAAHQRAPYALKRQEPCTSTARTKIRRRANLSTRITQLIMEMDICDDEWVQCQHWRGSGSAQPPPPRKRLLKNMRANTRQMESLVKGMVSFEATLRYLDFFQCWLITMNKSFNSSTSIKDSYVVHMNSESVDAARQTDLPQHRSS